MSVQSQGASLGQPGEVQRRLLNFLLDHLVWFILAITLAYLSVAVDRFFQIGIFINILRQATFVGILSVGLSLVIIAGHLDLSIESVMAFAGMLTTLLVATGGPPALGLDINSIWMLLLAFAVGGAVGLFNGLLVTKLSIDAFIVTLATWTAFRGMVHVVSGGRTPRSLPPGWRMVATERVLGLPVLALILIATFVIFHFILTRTRFGRHIYLIGGNRMAPFRAGIAVDRVVIGTFMLSGALAGFAGWLLAARVDGFSANLGFGMLFDAFAAVVIGGVSLRGGIGRLSGVFAGVLLLGTISTAITVMRIPVEYTLVIKGALVLFAVLLDSLKLHIRRRYL